MNRQELIQELTEAAKNSDSRKIVRLVANGTDLALISEKEATSLRVQGQRMYFANSVREEKLFAQEMITRIEAL